MQGWEKKFWKCVSVFPTCNVTVKTLQSVSVCAKSCWHCGILMRAARSGELRLQDAYGWGAISRGGRLRPSLNSGLCLSPCVCRMGCTTRERSSWLYIMRPGMATLVIPKKHSEEVRAAVLKAVQRGLGCLVLIKNWWENRCQNPGFDIINLPAPNKS